MPMPLLLLLLLRRVLHIIIIFLIITRRQHAWEYIILSRSSLVSTAAAVYR